MTNSLPNSSMKPFDLLSETEKSRLRRIKCMVKHGPKMGRKRLAQWVISLAKREKLA